MSTENNKIILYHTADGNTKIEVTLDDETVWLSQLQMSELFQKTVPTINEHIKNVFLEGELEEKPTIRKFRIVQLEGVRNITRDVDFYNLDVIISVGYRVKSHRGTQFRIWATQKLKEFIIKGFVMDDDRLANGGAHKPYFQEWEERIRKIRTSEANFYQKVRDVFATSVDYNPKTDYAQTFFATVQNKDIHNGATDFDLLRGTPLSDTPPRLPLSGEVTKGNHPEASPLLRGARGVPLPYNPRLIELARQNRHRPTKAESTMWIRILSDKRFKDLKFTRQKPLENFIADFYCAKLLLVIEIDGQQHEERKEYDQLRSDILRDNYNIQVIRYNNKDVLNNLTNVYEDLAQQIENRKQHLRHTTLLRASPYQGRLLEE